MVRHFLSLLDLSRAELTAIIDRAIVLKRERKQGQSHDLLKNKTLALIFEKSSTRTRTSFEAAATQCGGNTLFLAPGDSQLGRGEPIEDTARVVSSMVEAIAIRAEHHSTVERFAKHSAVPVINALTDKCHPCQLLADLQTVYERLNTVEDIRVAWIGDGNNVCYSWMNAAAILGFDLAVATPPTLRPDNQEAMRSGRITLEDDPEIACKGAQVVVTDTWISMGQEQEKSERVALLQPYQVTEALMAIAGSDAMFMHCLPAYRGLEVSANVIDGPRSAVWDEAENRLHAQKALLELLLDR